MIRKKSRNGSLNVKLAAAFLAAAIFQSVLLSGLLLTGGVTSQAEENAYTILSEKVENRADNLESNMNYVWTNFDNDLSRLKQYFTEQEAGEGLTDVDALLEGAAPIVLDSLYYTKATGAFLILSQEAEKGSYPALYFKNANPDRNEDTNVYMLAGPWNVADKLKLVTDREWSYRLKLDESNQDFFTKPYENVSLSGDTELLAYWAKPFKVVPKGEEVITYSIPFCDKKGNPVGVFGVEISLSHLYHYLPSTELVRGDSYGYVIGIKKQGEDFITVAAAPSSVQKRYLEPGMKLALTPQSQENSIFYLDGLKMDSRLAACVKGLGMYYNNTPFSGEEWYLIGLVSQASLMSFPDRIGQILLTSFFISLVLGSAVAVVISNWFTRSSRLMELSDVSVGAFETYGRGGRVAMTVQVPSLLQMTRRQVREYSRDKRKFLEYLNEICKNRTEEDHVYFLTDQGKKKWLRIMTKEDGGNFHGIVVDVTEETEKKCALEAEANYDGLTGVENRKAYHKLVRRMNRKHHHENPPALIMCDLNNLKTVNDTRGHIQGDKYIKEAARLLSEAFPNGRVFRIGGDEFVVILNQAKEKEIEDGLLELDEQMKAFGEKEDFSASVAAGYAVFKEGEDESLEDVFARADAAMYQDKKRKKAGKLS